MTVHFCINGCGKVAPAPNSETGPEGCHPATDDVADDIIDVSVVIIDVSVDIEEFADANIDVADDIIDVSDETIDDATMLCEAELMLVE